MFFRNLILFIHSVLTGIYCCSEHIPAIPDNRRGKNICEKRYRFVQKVILSKNESRGARGCQTLGTFGGGRKGCHHTSSNVILTKTIGHFGADKQRAHGHPA